MKEIVYNDECYKIIGACLEVHKTLMNVCIIKRKLV